MLNIMERIEAHKAKVFEHYPKEQILGIFAYGSMNYGLMTENSDVDTKVIYIPTVEDLILGGSVSKELHIDDEHAEVKDLRNMVNMWKKQNINFLEILFDIEDKTCWVNEKYKEAWKKWFVDNAEDICRTNVSYGVRSICGQAMSTLIDKTNGKKVCNGLRLKDFILRYMAGEPYKDCLTPKEDIRQMCMKYKTGEMPVEAGIQNDLAKWFFEMKSTNISENNNSGINLDKLLIGFMKEVVIK